MQSYTLGFLLLRGSFFRRNELDGEWWINRACRLGHAQACTTAEQRRLHRDYRLYRPLFQAAAANHRRCRRGNQSACVRLGIAILISRWFRRDKGFELPSILRLETSPYTLLTFQSACQKRNALACRALATLYYHGDMWVHQDVRKTLRFYEMACDLADARSCYRLGTMYYLADKTPHDFRRAIAAFDKGCALRASAACYAAGFALSHGRETNHPKAIGFYDKGCKHGYARACFVLAKRYRQGSHVAPNQAGCSLPASSLPSRSAGSLRPTPKVANAQRGTKTRHQPNSEAMSASAPLIGSASSASAEASNHTPPQRKQTW